jgi:ribonuclease D
MQINSKYILVQDKKSLELALVHLNSAKALSVDTESSGFYTYHSKICLIQITANGKNFIFDPFAQMDIKLLGNLFKNVSILKIFHSAIDDIKALKRDFGFEFKNIADTMYSSKLLGLEHNSLNFLVEFYHKVSLSKTEQKSNWEKRPLDKQQLQYAALDTAYLESIWEKMSFELESQKLLDEAKSEFEKISSEPPHPKEVTNEVHWYKFPEIETYSPEERRSVQDILSFREEKAKRMNKAPFRVISNQIISKIVKKEMKTEEFAALLGKKDSLELEKILQNPSGPPLEKSNIPKADFEVKPEEELRKWREKVMKKRNIDHSMLPSNKQILQMIRLNISSIDELDKMNVLSKWKLENYGSSILKALNKENYDEDLTHLVVLKNSKKKNFPPKKNDPKKKDSPKSEKKIEQEKIILDENTILVQES